MAKKKKGRQQADQPARALLQKLRHAYVRAWELCQQVGEMSQLLLVLRLLVAFYGTQGDHQTAREMAEQYLAGSEQTGDTQLVAIGRWILGWVLLHLGELTQAQAHLEHNVWFDPQPPHALAVQYGYDPRIVRLLSLAWTLWLLGYPNQAAQQLVEALVLAQELAHPLSLALTQGIGAIFHIFRRDVQTSQVLAEACLSLSGEHGFLPWLGGHRDILPWLGLG